MRVISDIGMLLVSVIVLSTSAHGQYWPGEPGGGPFTREPVLNAPFSAKAVTSVRERLPNNTVREETVTATYYRDSQGRVRAELDNPFGQYVILGIPDPNRWLYYALDPTARTYRIASNNVPRTIFNAEGRVALPVGKSCFRVAPPVGGTTESERLEAVNAQVSPDLGVVIASQRSDQIASVDYELTNIRREEPPAELFDLSMLARGAGGYPLVAFDRWNSKRLCAAPTRDGGTPDGR